MSALAKLRIIFVLLIFLVFYSVFIIRLFYWQVIKASELKNQGIKQSSQSFEVVAKRGTINSFDNYPLATNRESYLVYINPKLIKNNLTSYAQSFANLLDLEEASVSALLTSDLYWVKIANNINIAQKSNIENLNFSGVGFQENSFRLYPEASMAAQVIGFVGKDNNGNDRGYFGIEGYYNTQLSGRSGNTYIIHDALGNPILNDIREEKKIDGRNLTLNIDRTVQFIIERYLKEGVEKYQADGGSVVVMEPKTGRILAMASLPKFDPQKYYEYNDNTYKNPIISSLYEPGSTFKVLVMAAAIDMNLVTPDARCNICSEPVVISDYTVKTWNNKYYPNSTMTDVIVHSDNTGMVFVARKLGINNLLKYLKLYGIDELTGIDLQGEISGIMRQENQWYPIDLATAGFGQGISLTPLELLLAISSIANNGNLVKPYVVSQIIDEKERKIEVKPEIKRRVMKETTAKVVTEMMVKSVDSGESKWTKLANYKVAGKTGTAQIPIKGHYDPSETIASFIGFFPADDPKVSMLVLVNKPKTSIYGSETAAPIFFSIAKELVNYYDIPPSY